MDIQERIRGLVSLKKPILIIYPPTNISPTQSPPTWEMYSQRKFSSNPPPTLFYTLTQVYVYSCRTPTSNAIPATGEIPEFVSPARLS